MKKLTLFIFVFIFSLLLAANYNKVFAECGTLLENVTCDNRPYACNEECLLISDYTDPDYATVGCASNIFEDNRNALCICDHSTTDCDGGLNRDECPTTPLVTTECEIGATSHQVPPYVDCGDITDTCCSTQDECAEQGIPQGVCHTDNECILGYCCLHELDCCGDELDDQRCDTATIPDEEEFIHCYVNQDTNEPYCTCTQWEYGFPGVNQPLPFCVPSTGQRSTVAASGGIYTAIGCIPVASTQEFVVWILRWAGGIAGGVAFILIIYAGFMIITSAGNPQRVQAGKELLTAAISGIILLIFGAFILEFIGVDILNIPGFGD